MIGLVIVDVTLDHQQNPSWTSKMDGRYWTRLQPFGIHDADDLDLPMDGNIVMSAEYSYGRDRFIVGDFETGLARITLNNDNGEWSPLSGVNTIGGDKLAPGQFIRIAVWYDPTDVHDHLEDITDHAWTAQSYYVERDIADAETVTGSVDGATWTAHGSDIDLDLHWIVGDGLSYETDMVSWRQIRFMGRILHVEDRYDPGGIGSTTVVTAVDVQADLAQYNPGALGSPRSAEGTDDRATYAMTQGLTTTDLFGSLQIGLYNVESSDLPNNYLEELRIAARAEGGAAFADHGGRLGLLTFKAANWLIEDPRSATIQAWVGGPYIGIDDATTEYSLSTIFNDIYYSNSSTTKNESDATSIAAHSTRALRREVANHSATDLETLAERDLAILKDPQLLIRGVVIKPTTLLEEIFCQQTRIGDLIHVKVQNDGWSYRQLLHIAGISESWDAQTGEWICRLRLDSREGDTVVT